MTEIVKKTKTEGCKELFSKICDTVRCLTDNKTVLMNTGVQKEKSNQAKMEKMLKEEEARRLVKEEWAIAAKQVEAMEEKIIAAILEVKII